MPWPTCPSQLQRPQSQLQVARGIVRSARASMLKKPSTSSSPRGVRAPQAHVPWLPGGRQEASRGLAEDLREGTLPTLEDASRVFGIQAVHLVAAAGQATWSVPSLADADESSREAEAPRRSPEPAGSSRDAPRVATRRASWGPRRRRDDARAMGARSRIITRVSRAYAGVASWIQTRKRLIERLSEFRRIADRARQTPERPREIGLAEVRPQNVGEVELSVSRLPQQEVTQSLLSASADQQIHVTRTASVRESLRSSARSNASRAGGIPLAKRPAAANNASRAE